MKRYMIPLAMVSGLGFVLLCTIALDCASNRLPSPPATGAHVVLASAIEIDPLDTTHVDQLPVLTHFTPPDYPRLARQAGMEGRVWVRVYVDESGVPQDAQAYQSSGTHSFDDSVVRSAYQCKYLPAQYQGRNVAVRIIYAVDFKLL